MAQFNKKRKLFNLYQTQIKNGIDLERKKNRSKKRYIASPTFKAPKVLYDSGWISVTNNLNGNIVGPGIDQDPFAFGDLHFFAQATTTKNQIVPMDLFFYFMKDIEIAEQWLPFVKSTLMVKTHPTVKTVGIFQYIPTEYDTSKYARIKGGSTVIYQGYNPFATKHTQDEIDNGDLLISLTSKWFKGDINFSMGGDSWEYRDTNLLGISTYYDASVSGAPGGDKYNYKFFVVNAVDSISGGSVSGTGYFEEHEWNETSPGVWEETITVTRNKTMSAPILEDITRISVRFGTKFKNGQFQGSIGGAGTSILTDGELQNASNVPSFDKIGTVPRGSVSHTLVHETVFGDPTNGLYRLWYSNKRTLEFNINGNYELQNLPFVGAYQSGSLPYGQITVEVNPDPYPVEEIGNEAYYRGNKTEVWGRITPLNTPRPTFRYFATGTILMTAPAEKDNGTTAFFVDESYSNHGSGFYEKDGDNRDPKPLSLYIPEQNVIEFRLKLTLANPKYYRNVRRHKK